MLESDANSEWFYLFKTQNETLVISAIEILRYFYLTSPGPSLVNQILDPSGIHHLARSIETNKKISQGKKYPYFQIDIHPFSQMIDINKIFFFSCSIKNRHYFSSIAHRFLTTSTIDTSIPTSRELRLVADVYQQNGYKLVTKIHESNIASYMRNWIVDYTHPRSKPHAVKEKEQPFQTMQQADASIIVSHDQYTNKRVKPKRVYDDSQFFGEGKLANPKFPLGPTFNHVLLLDEEQVVAKSSKIPEHLGDRNIALSGQGLNKDGPIAIKAHTKQDKSRKPKDALGSKEDENKHTLYDEAASTKLIENIAQAFKDHGYSTSIEYKNVKRLYHSKKIECNAIKYYAQILVKRDDLRFIYVDILAKQYAATPLIYDEKKEVLLIKCDKRFKDQYVKEFIYDQLVEGNHKWGIKSPYKMLFTYTTIKHRKDLKSFVGTILEMMAQA